MEEKGVRKWLLDELVLAFESARTGKLRTFDEHSFELHQIENIVSLRDSILSWHYEPGASVAFVIFEPMIREIFAAPFRDRVIHHFLYNMQAGWWDTHFVYDSYSCRVGKGTHFGVQRIHKFMQAATDNFTRGAKVIQLDLSGYFMSLPRLKLYDRVKWGMDRQFAEVIGHPMGQLLYDICDFLWKQVLLDDPASKAWKRGPLHNWHPSVLPPRKSLFCQPEGQGIVIGNLTSQLVSNIYLDQLDHFMKFDLGCEYCGRYVDDFIRIVRDEDYEKALSDIKRIEEFLAGLGLKVHPDKRYIQDVTKGIHFLGARIYPHCIYPSDRLQSHFKRMMHKLTQGEADVSELISYFGILGHQDAENFIHEIFDYYGLDFELVKP